MPIFKQIWTFTQPVGGTFSEVYYQDQPNLAASASLDTFLLLYTLLARHPLTVLNKVRVSAVTNNRITTVVNVNRGGAYPGTGGPDVTGTAAVITLNAPSQGFKRQLWMRGLAQSAIGRNPTTGADALQPNLAIAINNVLSRLAAANYQVQGLAKIGTNGQFFIPVTGITVVGPGNITILTPGTTWVGVTPARVVLSQFSPKTWPGLNGHWTIQNPANGSFGLIYNSVLPAGNYPLPRGRVRQELYLYGAVDSKTSAFNFYGERKTRSRPTGSRGRRSTVHLRSL